jgi:hypothetical protein
VNGLPRLANVHCRIALAAASASPNGAQARRQRGPGVGQRRVPRLAQQLLRIDTRRIAGAAPRRPRTTTTTRVSFS